MRMITLTKKKVKRLTAIGLLAAATAAAGVGAILTSVGTQATERQLPVYCVPTDVSIAPTPAAAVAAARSPMAVRRFTFFFVSVIIRINVPPAIV